MSYSKLSPERKKAISRNAAELCQKQLQANKNIFNARCGRAV